MYKCIINHIIHVLPIADCLSAQAFRFVRINPSHQIIIEEPILTSQAPLRIWHGAETIQSPENLAKCKRREGGGHHILPNTAVLGTGSLFYRLCNICCLLRFLSHLLWDHLRLDRKQAMSNRQQSVGNRYAINTETISNTYTYVYIYSPNMVPTIGVLT